ncbi:hypothetical protein AAJ76_8800012944 [Vairimorpha ceranae]|uniref:Uncharacterized protein n=1 Tax=Vairimorpha ceranae TaxID=40302 RepID=A0A0F9W9C9_9MICR|nr:hypothetical protein AAJ76_8800012944 [Vairimorpha ceranae]KKO74286.1 hypothetical protein AAJ76_8800012944 [Vairimorpha ceranae]
MFLYFLCTNIFKSFYRVLELKIFKVNLLFFIFRGGYKNLLK